MAKETKPKNTSSRVEPVKSATKEARKREVSGKIQKTTTQVEGHRNDVATKKRKLEELSKTYNDNAKAEEKAEYENLKAEVAKLDAELMEWEADLEKLNKEEKDIDMDAQENGVDGGLFVPPGKPMSSSSKPYGTPLVDLTEPNGKSKPLIVDEFSDDDEALFTPAQAREATGQDHGGEIVAWRQQDRSKPVIVRHGPQNAAKYERSTAAKEDNDFDEEEIEEFGPDHRLGDVKFEKRFVRRRRELLGIVGLAYNCDLEDLKPREKGETRKVAPLEIWVKWEIGGVIKKKWEIRSSIRHLFSNAKKCDAYIYEAAKWHAARYKEWQNGQREAKERSPTPVPNSRLSPTPDPAQPVIKIEDEESHNPLAVTNSTVSSKASKRAAMLQYREQWCDLKGIDLEDMEPAAEGRFLKAWNEIKDSV